MASEPPPSGAIGRLLATPQSDIPIKRGGARRRSSSSRFHGAPRRTFVNLPSFADVPAEEHAEVFLGKIEQCCIVFDFLDENESVESAREKELKRATLVELIDFVLQAPHVVQPTMYAAIVNMVKTNLFRPLPPRLNPNGLAYDPEEDEPILEAAWPHIQIVYELFLHFLDMPDFAAKKALADIDDDFVRQLVELFDTEDPRERDYLKTTLHRVYGKFLPLRPTVRAEAMSVFISVAFEGYVHNGVAELLEILGSIVNGFAIPIKPEHTRLLMQALLPLHKARHLSLFHAQLTYCVAQYLEKEPALCVDVFPALMRYWPRYHSSHAVLMLEEMQQLLQLLNPEHFELVEIAAFSRIAMCLESDHFQISERALSVWRNEYIWDMTRRNRHQIMPLVFPSLLKTSKQHWHMTIRQQAYDTMKRFMDVDMALFTACTEAYKANAKSAKRAARRNANLWRLLEERAKLIQSGTARHQLPPLEIPSSSGRRSQPNSASNSTRSMSASTSGLSGTPGNSARGVSASPVRVGAQPTSGRSSSSSTRKSPARLTRVRSSSDAHGLTASESSESSKLSPRSSPGSSSSKAQRKPSHRRRSGEKTTGDGKELKKKKSKKKKKKAPAD